MRREGQPTEAIAAQRPAQMGGAAESQKLPPLTNEAAQNYSRGQVWLHWLIALLVLVQLSVNADVRRAFRERLGGGEAEPAVFAWFHVLIGLAVLGLTLFRLMLRLRLGAPPPPNGGPRVFEWMGIAAHWGLYVLLIGMTLTGAVAWFLSSALAATMHEIGRLALVALILAHMLGALVEHYVFGNRVIRRMRPR